MQQNARNAPYGKIESVPQIGEVIRRRRKELGMTQTELAEICGVGLRFLSEVERGKKTAALGKVLDVLIVLGLELSLTPRS